MEFLGRDMAQTITLKAIIRTLFFLILLPVGALAQNIFYVEHAGTMRAVRKMREARAYVENSGKFVPASGSKCLLNPVAEYLPRLVTIRKKEALFARTTDTERSSAGRSRFVFSAEFESAWKCSDAFFVLEISTSKLGLVLFCHEIGDLEPNIPKTVSCNVGVLDNSGVGNYTVHVFVGGIEVFTSDQSFAFRESTLDRMVAKRVEGTKQAGPKLFSGPQPVYPTELKQEKMEGQVSVAFKIAENGTVHEIEVLNATHPAFAQAVKFALWQWRFLPKVEEGQVVETTVTMPFEFKPETSVPTKS